VCHLGKTYSEIVPEIPNLKKWNPLEFSIFPTMVQELHQNNLPNAVVLLDVVVLLLMGLVKTLI
jgi:hypothetical protein